MGSIPESGRSPEEENGNPLQYSCLEKSMDRGARRAAGPWAYMTEHVAIKNFKKKKRRDAGLVPGWGRSPGGGNGSPLWFLARRILWTEEPGGLQSMGFRVGHD